jgi:hypothetical protein
MIRHLTATAALGAAVATAAIGTAGATGEPGRAASAPQKITPAGVGDLTVGATARELRAKGLIGRLTEGCELAGPGTRAAPLRAPLRGAVDFTMTSPRKVQTIAISGGATARGIGAGSTASALRKAFPKARFDHRTDDTFEFTLVKVPRNGGGRLQFAVSVKTKKVELIGVPFIPFCE